MPGSNVAITRYLSSLALSAASLAPLGCSSVPDNGFPYEGTAGYRLIENAIDKRIPSWNEHAGLYIEPGLQMSGTEGFPGPMVEGGRGMFVWNGYEHIMVGAFDGTVARDEPFMASGARTGVWASKGDPRMIVIMSPEEGSDSRCVMLRYTNQGGRWTQTMMRPVPGSLGAYDEKELPLGKGAIDRLTGMVRKLESAYPK